NSWMQTPAGYEIVDGRFFPKDWFAIVFSPSFPFRLTHTVTGFFVTTGFVVVAGAAWLIPQGRSRPQSRGMLVMTPWLLNVPGPPADIPGRPARTPHRRASAGEGCRHRGALGYPAVLSAHAVRHSRPGQRGQSLRDRGALSRQPHPDP